MNQNRTFGLKMHITSINLPRQLLKDEVRVSVTTIPEESKQNKTIRTSQMQNCNINFCLNVKLPPSDIPDEFVFSGTEKIVVVFRKKTLFTNPIIASTNIKASDFPKNYTDFIQKSFNIYEPVNKSVQYQDRSFIGNYGQSPSKILKRKVTGSMQVELSLVNSIPLNNLNDNKLKDLRKMSSMSDNDENLMTYDNYNEYTLVKH